MHNAGAEYRIPPKSALCVQRGSVWCRCSLYRLCAACNMSHPPQRLHHMLGGGGPDPPSIVGEMVHLNIHFPSPKPKLNLEAFERRFRSASMMTVTTGRSLLFALLGGLRRQGPDCLALAMELQPDAVACSRNSCVCSLATQRGQRISTSRNERVLLFLKF